MTVHNFPPRHPEPRPPIAGGGGPPQDTLMESRVAVLENIAKSTEGVLKDLREDGRELRRAQERDFRILFGAIIATALGLAGLMAKGFKWF
jgi:hypothetical protein